MITDRVNFAFISEVPERVWDAFIDGLIGHDELIEMAAFLWVKGRPFLPYNSDVPHLHA